MELKFWNFSTLKLFSFFFSSVETSEKLLKPIQLGAHNWKSYRVLFAKDLKFGRLSTSFLSFSQFRTRGSLFTSQRVVYEFSRIKQIDSISDSRDRPVTASLLVYDCVEKEGMPKLESIYFLIDFIMILFITIS